MITLGEQLKKIQRKERLAKSKLRRDVLKGELVTVLSEIRNGITLGGIPRIKVSNKTTVDFVSRPKGVEYEYMWDVFVEKLAEEELEPVVTLTTSFFGKDIAVISVVPEKKEA